MAKPIRLAVIGSGRWGKNILKTLDTFPECTVAYTATREYASLLLKDDIDAVIVATPGGTHAQVALPFIKKGLPTFIEKPLTMTLRDAKRVVVAGKKYRAPIFVGHIHLYSPAYQLAKNLAKTAGKLRLMIGEGASSGPFRDDMSAMWDWAPHDLSMMLDIAGTKPIGVEAWGVSVLRPKTRLHDFNYMKLNFPSGLVGVIHSSKISPEKRRKFTIVGAKDSVVYDDTAEKKVIVYKGIGPSIVGKKITTNQPEVLFPTYSSEMSLTEELKAFLKMVRTKKVPTTGALQGLEVVAILEAAEKSISLGGKPIRIKR
jgi:predicted dehydrogenase